MDTKVLMIQGLTYASAPDGSPRLRVELKDSGPRAITMGRLVLGALMPGVMSKAVQGRTKAINTLEVRPHYYTGSKDWSSLTATKLDSRLRSILDSGNDTFVKSVVAGKAREVKLELSYSCFVSEHTALLTKYLCELPAVKEAVVRGSTVTLKVKWLVKLSTLEQELRQHMRFSL